MLITLELTLCEGHYPWHKLHTVLSFIQEFRLVSNNSARINQILSNQIKILRVIIIKSIQANKNFYQKRKDMALPGDISTNALKRAFSGSPSLNVLKRIHRLNMSSTKCSPSGNPRFMSSRFTGLLCPSRYIVLDAASMNCEWTTQATYKHTVKILKFQTPENLL